MQQNGPKGRNVTIEKPHGIKVAFKDPGGNVLDLYQATPENLKEFVKEQSGKIDKKTKADKKES